MPRLHLAAASGDVEKVKAFIAEGDDINDMKESVTHEGQVWTPSHDHAGRKMTPLHLAAYNGHTEIVTLMVKAGALLDARDAWRDVPGSTALEMAVCQKNLTTAITLYQLGAEIGVEVLQKAIRERNIRDELMHAAIYRKPQNIYAIYAEGSLEKEAGEYALRLAAEYGTLSIIKALLDCGVDVNACDPNEPIGINSMWWPKTPLGVAAEYGHDQAVILLLERGAEVDKPTHISSNQKTNTPLRQAMCHLGFKNSNPKLFENLLSYGADYKKVDDIAWSFFAEKGSAEEMAVFLKYGFDPNMQYKGKPYLLHYSERRRLSIFAIRDAQLDFPIAQFLEKFEAEQNLISEATGFYDLCFSCQINFSEKTAPEVLEALVEKMKQQGLNAKYKPSSSRSLGIHSGPYIEIGEKKAILKSWVDSNDANCKIT